MVNHLRSMIGVKGIICLVALIVIVVAQLTYTATVNISLGTTGFAQGKSIEDWTIYTNIDEVRYLPDNGGDGDATPPFSESSSDTWAFKVTTNTVKGMAVEIELVDYTKTQNFTKFEITVMWYNTTASAWQSAQLYNGPTASAGTKSSNLINGTLSDFGYIHQARATSGTLVICYLIKVAYYYQSTATGPSVQFKYTPTPEDTL